MLKRITVTLLCFVAFWLCLLTDSCMRANNDSNAFTIARDPTWFPINLMGKDTNLIAFTNELLQAIADVEGITIYWSNSLAEDLFEGLEEQEYDAILTFKTPSSRNRQNFLFSDHFFFVGSVLLVQEDSTIQSLNEMENSVIGIEKGTSLSFGIDRYPSLIFLPYDNPISELDALAHGFIDGAILPSISAYTYANSLYRDVVRVVPQFLTQEGLKVAALHTTRGEAFVHHFNHGLETLQANGTYDALLVKWGFHDMERLYQKSAEK